jgi:hypothetical protein
VRLLLGLGLVALLSGCEGVPDFGAPDPYPEKTGNGTGPTLWLNFTLINLGDEDREAFLGPHCGTARPSTEWIRDRDYWTTRNTYESVFVDETAYRQLGEKRPFLVVTYAASASPGARGFMTTGQEGFPGAFPFVLDPRIGSYASGSERPSTPIARIDHRDGRVYVEGNPVTLPYTWQGYSAGDWSATFELSEGPSDVDLFRMENCA